MEHDDDPQTVCSNGHDVTEYPDQFRNATRIGINFRGWVEYADTEKGIVYEMLYLVDDDRIESLRTHGMLADEIDDHISESEDSFDEWRLVE